MQKERSPHINLAQSYWKKHLKSTDLAIDATCGNGHDTLFLSQLCKVIGLDIQPSAIENTKNLVGAAAELHLLSHEWIDTLGVSPNLIVYNLGYLPKGDKSITTKLESTLISIRKSLEILVPGGALSITCYPGHDEGLREEEAILKWANELPFAEWSACHHRWLNRPRSPSLLWIVKL
jgi:methylase of polypeptide subunit release factors